MDKTSVCLSFGYGKLLSRTDASGFYEFPEVRPGACTVGIEAKGATSGPMGAQMRIKSALRAVELAEGETLWMDLTVDTGSIYVVVLEDSIEDPTEGLAFDVVARPQGLEDVASQKRGITAIDLNPKRPTPSIGIIKEALEKDGRPFPPQVDHVFLIEFQHLSPAYWEIEITLGQANMKDGSKRPITTKLTVDLTQTTKVTQILELDQHALWLETAYR